MHPSEIMLTNMNDFLALKTEHLFPVVMSLFEQTTLSYIAYTGIALILLGFFPEVCWLAGLVSTFFMVLTLILGPFIYLFSPLIIVMFFGTFLALFGVGGGGYSSLFIGLILFVVALYWFCVFMAIFDEEILIPWFFLAIIP